MDIYANARTFETTFAGRPLIVETGKYAGLANGACMIRYGDTCVLATATASAKPREGIDYFPLSVDYEEKLYSVGKIPGGFLKREGKPTEKAILASRVIDRPFRPLFPKDMRNDVVVSTTLMSVDNDYLPEITAMMGASIAVAISDIPWNGPVAGLSLGYIDGEYVFNPTSSQRLVSDMAITVAATEEKIVMIEAGANEVPDDIILKGIIEAHKELKKMCRFIKDIQAEIGKPKFSYDIIEVDHDLYEDVKAFAYEKIEYCLDTDDKDVRDARLLDTEAEIVSALIEKYPEIESSIGEVLYKLQKEIVRKWLFEDHRRVDGRALDEIRPLHAEVGVLPRVHGSGLFSRGQTQVLTIATLGLIAEKQKLDGIDDEDSKRYMHHYNMTGYSVGDAKSSRGAGRREIGHGALAERSLEPVLPTEEEFPYAIRLVSEVLSSNGSTSQGSVCGSTLALMDAGVPIKAPVAGISCGLITKGDEWQTMIDIQGLEDFYGDMDFKVAGTKKGITSIQVDIKIDGLTYEMIEKAFEVTRAGRIKIIDELLLKTIPAPRDQLSPYAPKIITYGIPAEKIRDVIGTGGKVIQKIIADTGVKIDIEDDGKAYISYIDETAGRAALETIKLIVEGPQVGKLYYGKVVRIMEFGAFVEIAPGKDGLVHISKLDEKRVNKVEDVVNIGDEIWVKVVEIDRMGRINLSRKDALKEISGNKDEVSE